MSRYVFLSAILAAYLAPALAADVSAPASQPAAAAPAAAAPAAVVAPAPVAKPAAEPDKPVATVNGVVIPKVVGDILRSQAQRSGGQLVTDEAVKEEAVRLELISQEALKQGLDKTPMIQIQLDLQRKYALAKALVQDYARKHLPTEEAMKAEYDRIKAATPPKMEYLAHHILVPTEKQAKELIAKLDSKKAKFEDLAKKDSKDTGSAKKGGELQWSPADAFVDEFSKALTQLKKGEMTKTPVKTSFGWHIIRLDDTRKQEFPAYEKVKHELGQEVQQKEVDEYVAKLRAAAKVE